MCFKNAKYIINKLITYICSFKDAFHMGSIGFGPIDANVGYFKRIEKDYIISVSEATQLTRNYANINITPIEGTQVKFSVTIYDVAAYYGAFTNPPALKSPDVLPSNIFEVSGTAMREINTLKTNKVGWFRLLRWYGGLYFNKVVSRFAAVNLWPHTYYFDPGYHAQSSGFDQYDAIIIECGVLSSYYSGSSYYNVYLLNVRMLGQKIGAYPKFRFARGTEPLYKGNVSGQTDLRLTYYDLYLEAYYSQNVGSNNSTIYADNLINTPLRMDNVSGNPDGNDDVLIGSEVVPTLIGTPINIS